MNHRINKGLSTTVEKIITPADTYVTNEVRLDYLLSTPALLATMIEISWNLFKPLIPDDYITVVASMEMDHSFPSLVGERVFIKLVVDDIVENKIYINITGTDEVGVFCTGKMVKSIVKSNRLLEAAYKRIK